ncbi:MAG: prepilin-type N-terminal cleavage/methylation domain-containing protein [Candidatus Pacebacteria bacterium]|nr:prepilin-type N-terminal cleavage/methylation domain-containing protein [Candidatus Paceibacterota bacterium]
MLAVINSTHQALERGVARQRRRQIGGNPTHSFFTLIELLVVVSIIAILASLLLPALRDARESALAIACMNKMRQYGVGAQLYMQDSDGRLPCAWDYGGRTWCGPQGWATRYALGVETTITNFAHGTFQKEAKEKQWYLCPALGGANPEPSEQYFDIYSYGMNISFGMPLWGYPFRYEKELKEPSRTVMIVDMAGRVGDGSTYYLSIGNSGSSNYYSYRHPGGINVLFADGRVERRQAPLPYWETPEILWWF